MEHRARQGRRPVPAISIRTSTAAAAARRRRRRRAASTDATRTAYREAIVFVDRRRQLHRAPESAPTTPPARSARRASAARAVTPKTIIYGATELLTSDEFVAQIKALVSGRRLTRQRRQHERRRPAKMNRRSCVIVSLTALMCLILRLVLTTQSASFSEVVSGASTSSWPVHVALSADRAQWRALLTCVNATLTHAREPHRFRFHVLCADARECSGFAQYCERASTASVCRAIAWTQFDASAIERRFGRDSVLSSAARNLSAPHNFARFYLARTLDASVHKVIWLDNDIIAQQDVAQLYDAALKRDDDDDNFALAAVVQRRSFDDSMVRRILYGLQGKPFGKATSPGGKRPRELDLRHGGVLSPLLERVKACNDTDGATGIEPRCFHFNAGVAVYRLDRWRERNITAAIEEWLLFLADNPAVAVGLTQPPLVFYFWDRVEPLDAKWNVGSAADIVKMAENNDPRLAEAALLHFNGDAKPWLSPNERIAKLWRQHAPTIEPDELK
jgi:lipopolysaccharide biosynthesis glycosyltransferase